jgi:hypothetical protein
MVLKVSVAILGITWWWIDFEKGCLWVYGVCMLLRVRVCGGGGGSFCLGGWCSPSVDLEGFKICVCSWF